MKRRTAALTITFALAILPTLHRHAIADTAPTPGVAIVDSTQRIIGALLSPGYGQTRFNGIWVGYNVGPAGFMVSNDFGLFYGSADCTGQAYMDASTLPVKGAVVRPGAQTFSNSGTLYYPGLPVRQINAASMMDASKVCQPLEPPVSVTVGPMTSATLTGYVLPFAIR